MSSLRLVARRLVARVTLPARLVAPALPLIVALHSGAAFAQPAEEAAADTKEPEPPADAAAHAPAPLPAPAPVPAAAPTNAPAVAAEPVKKDEKEGWKVSFYGQAALNVVHDSTQGVGEGLNNNKLPRPGSYRTEHDQLQFSARDSRVGFTVAAPDIASFFRLSARGEIDFRGVTYPEISENDLYVFGGPRLRHFYLEAKNPIVDILAGQYEDLFGWGGAGFYPNTVAYLGITGQIFHRNPQLRLTKELDFGAVGFDIAAAAVRPVQRASGVPDMEGGLKIELPIWKGARTPGYGKVDIGALAVGVSGILRRLEPIEFEQDAGDSVNAWAWGYAVNALVPVLPADDKHDVSNALTLTGEFSQGTGIADMYTELTGGVLWPTLPDLQGDPIPPIYRPNMDPGIATFDGEGNLKTINWRAFVVGLQYYLPFWKGRVSISGNYSQLESTNAEQLTPVPNRQAVYDKAVYWDANLFLRLTEEFRVAGSFQTVEQTFSDHVSTRNNRIQGAMHFFF
jgi:hypothetical protein